MFLPCFLNLREISCINMYTCKKLFWKFAVSFMCFQGFILFQSVCALLPPPYFTGGYAFAFAIYRVEIWTNWRRKV